MSRPQLYVAEELGRQNEITYLADHLRTGHLRVLVGHLRIVEGAAFGLLDELVGPSGDIL